MVIQLLEYLVYNDSVLGYMVVFHFSLLSCRVDCHIVHIDHHTPIGDKVPKDGVHHSLECSRRIGESKEHDRWLK